MSFKRIDSGKRPQQLFSDAIPNSFALVGLVLIFAIFADAGSNISVAISPTATRMASGKSQQFSATVKGTSNTAVIWSVSAVLCQTPEWSLLRP